MTGSKYKEILNLKQHLKEAQDKIATLEAEIAWMKTSKFWKSRQFWIKIKSHLSRTDSHHEVQIHQSSEEVKITSSLQIEHLLPQSLPRKQLSVLLVVEESITHCFRYRVHQKIEQLQELGYKTDWVSWKQIELTRNLLHSHHIIIFYRVPGFADVITTIKLAKSLKKIVIFDIDDLIFVPEYYPEPFENYRHQLSREEYQGLVEGVKLYRDALSHCHFAISSTPTLKAVMEEIIGKGQGFCHRNGLDQCILNFVNFLPTKCDRNYLSIFYGSGTKTHDADFNLIAGPLAQLFEKYPQLRLTIIGYLNLPAVLKPYHSRIDRIPFLSNTEAYWQFLVQADINIAPLTSGKFNDCKSEIKWLEAAIFKVPSVVSATETYLESLEDGKEVLIASSAEAWEAKLERLIIDPAFREEIAQNAREKALQSYSPQALAKQLHSSLRWAIKLATESGIVTYQPEKKRLLFVNVLYPPQSLGGATAVLKNTLDRLRDKYDQEYELFVFTTDWDNPTPYQIRSETVEGVYVTRISIPATGDQEWRYQDSRIYEHFSDYLQAIQPDLIHFHCVQRLTASSLEAAADLAIPFVVTVHDAWWLGDCQFLIDGNGNPCDPHLHDPLIAARYSQDVSNTLQRQRYLATQLKKAQKLLAVSHSHAELYQKNGFMSAIASPNGIPESFRVSRNPSPDQKLRLGYAGGICTHKGYYLLKKAIEEANLQQTTLTVIDLFTTEGNPYWEKWGSTPVQFIPKIPFDQMSDLYSNIDVLVAPSIWPESFGLITREATLAGVWVVASNLGALAEDIKPGVHGDIFSPQHPEELVAILQKLDCNPKTYQQPIPPGKTTHIRTLTEQVEELHQFYHKQLSQK